MAPDETNKQDTKRELQEEMGIKKGIVTFKLFD